MKLLRFYKNLTFCCSSSPSFVTFYRIKDVGTKSMEIEYFRDKMGKKFEEFK